MQFEDNLKARMEVGEHPTLYGYSDMEIPRIMTASMSMKRSLTGTTMCFSRKLWHSARANG